MEVTRRGFIGKLVTGCGLLSAAWRLLAGDEPETNKQRRTTEFVRLGAYPGKVVPMGDIHTQAKWSG
jgi:hypothetical protein